MSLSYFDDSRLIKTTINRDRILRYVEIGKREGKPFIIRGPTPGHTVPLAIFTNILPSHRIAREEVFGPVLAVLRAKDLSEALKIANSTQYALTGGLFSRSPDHISRVEREFSVGNIYVNRGITGAVVGRHPFGGFKMYGLGTKAGGPDYFLHFMLPRCVAENTVRRGFVPRAG